MEAAYVEYHRLLGVEAGADDETLRKAYRRRALELHPDKNRDDPSAAAKFDAMNKAYEALMDKTMRAEFERKVAAKAAETARFKEMDAAKLAARQALEAREREAAAARGAASVGVGGRVSAARGAGGVAAGSGGSGGSGAGGHEALLARLRQEGRDLATEAGWEAAARARAAAPPPAAPRPPHAPDFSLAAAVRVHWTQAVNDAGGEDVMDSAGGAPAPALSERQLDAAFAGYGDVLAILSHRIRSAVIVFASATSATAAAAAPPPGFTVNRVTAEADSSEVGAAAAAAAVAGAVTAAAAGAGMKRPRPDSSTIRSLPGPASSGSTLPPPYAPYGSLADKEAAVFAALRAAFPPRQHAAVAPLHA